MYIHITAGFLELAEVSSSGDSFLLDLGARAGQGPMNATVRNIWLYIV
jgi:hypothetical protein